MERERKGPGNESRSKGTSGAPTPTPGKRTLVGTLQPKARGEAATNDVRVPQAEGAAIPASVAARFEQTTGASVADARVHTGPASAEAADRAGALAFTTGNDVHFAAGTYQPGMPAGDRLIAHELAHTVQQRGAAPAAQEKSAVSQPGDAAELEADAVADAVTSGGRATIVQTATGISRQQLPTPSAPPTPTAQQQTDHDDAVQKHHAEQRRIDKIIKDGLAKKPASTAPLDRDVLYRNSCEWLTNGLVGMTVLSPTHDWTTRRAGREAFFDKRVKYPAVGGDYDVLPGANTDEQSVDYFPPGYQGGMNNHNIELIGTLRHAEDKVIDTIIHEVQHDADASGTSRHDRNRLEAGHVNVTDAAGTKDYAAESRINQYQTEFRGHWMQSLGTAGDRFGSDTAAATNTRKVRATDPATSQPVEQTTNFKNERQEKVFWHMVDNTYPFALPYATIQRFRDMVDDFVSPQSINLINSVRVHALQEAIAECNTNQEVRHPKVLDVFAKTYVLDAADRAFLQGDAKLNKPFWDNVELHLGENPKRGLKDKIANPNAIKTDLPYDLRTPELIKCYEESTDEEAKKFMLAEMNKRQVRVFVNVVTIDDTSTDEVYILLENGGRKARSETKKMKPGDMHEFTMSITPLVPISGTVALTAFDQDSPSADDPMVRLDWKPPYAVLNNNYKPPYMVTVEFVY